VAELEEDDFTHYFNATGRLSKKVATLTKAGEELYQGLKDVINAAGNDEPYSAEELSKEFSPLLAAWNDAIGRESE
jgi:hypothetical protein